MANRLASVVTCGAWLIAAAAQAQSPAQSQAAPRQGTPPATSVAPLTVQAAPTPQVVQREARSFVQTYAGATPNIDQIARWNDAVCIEVAGLAPEQAAQVASRIQAVAKGVGMRILPPGCPANIEVIFTDKPQAVMDRVAERREQVLGYYHSHEKARLKTVTRPIQAWYVTATTGGGGQNVGLSTAFFSGATIGAGTPFSQLSGEVIDDPENPGPTGCADAPHFTRCLKSVLKNVLVVVDTSRLQGQDLGAVSDYLSMLTLSMPRSLDGCSGLASVIDMLAPSACPGRPAPDGLTPADAAYLTSLYAADLQASKTGAEGDISGRMAKILVQANRPAE